MVVKFVGEVDEYPVVALPAGVVGAAVDGRAQLGFGHAGVIGEIVRAQAPFESVAATPRHPQQENFALADGEMTGFKISDRSEPVGAKQPWIARENGKVRKWRLPRGRQLIELRLYFRGIGRCQRINSHAVLAFGGKGRPTRGSSGSRKAFAMVPTVR